ncbi:putative hydroxypyruvate isomerase [Coturnix japonica]|uniref:Putative hydroxypyruvate isomerase n=1 Tax=Coturnix japonica TaxID=93934 RepID=A0A8C2TEF9_COTJA|nr:putative hydroxypyruvate isomerase [Coturnix japonica]
MALRFSANLSWLFPELPALPARLEAAARAGFDAVESAWPEGCPATALHGAAERAGLRVVLLNTPPGDTERGEMGLCAVPGRQDAFRQGLAEAVRYGRAVGCHRIHLMAGRVPRGVEREAVAGEMEATFIENLRHAADVLAQEDMLGLVEPINSRITDPRYFLNTPHQAAAILEKVGRPNLKLQLDFFHCQIMDGNLSRNLETYLPLIGHIQIAQVPGRHEPDSPGELNFPYIFKLLESLGYTGYVGCEYAPKGDTVEGLGWLRSYWESRGMKPGGPRKATE